MTPWNKELLARAVMEELAPHPSGSWFTPQAIVNLEKFGCTEEMALEVFADLIKRSMLISSPFTVPIPGPKGVENNIYVSAWRVNDKMRDQISTFIHAGGLWNIYLSPTIKWFWGISRSRLLIIFTFIVAAFSGGFLAEAGSSVWELVKWDTPTSQIEDTSQQNHRVQTISPKAPQSNP